MSALQKDCVLLSLTFHRVGLNRRGEKSALADGVDRVLFGVSKQIMHSEAYDRAVQIAADTRRWIEARSLWATERKDCELHGVHSILRGAYFVPTNLLPEVYSRLAEAEKAYQEAADAFAAEYEACKANAALRLNSHYREADYPTVERVRSSFWVEWRLVDWGTPGAEKVGAAVHSAEESKARAFWSGVEQEVASAMRESMGGLVDRLVNGLGVKANGQRNVVTAATYVQFGEFLDLFSKRNVLNDSELAKLAEKAKAVMDGTSLDDLRYNEGFRAQAKQEFDQIAAGLDTLLQEPARLVVFEDD